MDTNGQTLKDNEKNIISDRSLKESEQGLNFFIKDKNFLSITKKTERLVSAFYLLTDLFPDQEPLKWTLRQCSLNIVPEALALNTNFNRENISSYIANSHILKLHSFLETAHMSGLISNMNFSLLQNEIFKLIGMETDYSRHDDSKDKNLSENYFSDDYKGQFRSEVELKKVPYEGLVQEKIASSFDKKINKRQNLSERVQLPVIQDFQATIAARANIDNSGESKKKKNERQIKIIDLIKNKKTVSIKDISDNIKGCSEKTIQRELIAMVKSGVLKKEGERRWSRYSLNL